MKEKFLEQAGREYSPKQRFVALLFMAPIFLFILPFIFIKLGAWLDQIFQFPPILVSPYNFVLGCLLILSGLLFAFWSNYSQFTLGRGTPVPLMATQKLIVQPPYTYCRNPMAAGAIGMYLGVALLFHSIGAVVLVLIFAGVLLIYIKRVEEKEMEIRFGSEYLDYKRKTPFLIPHFWGSPKRT